MERVQHGSGLSAFTMAPSLAYRIKNGKIADPLNISVITGDVFTTLAGDRRPLQIDWSFFFVLGGCGKNGTIPVAGRVWRPYVRVRNLVVQ